MSAGLAFILGMICGAVLFALVLVGLTVFAVSRAEIVENLPPLKRDA